MEDVKVRRLCQMIENDQLNQIKFELRFDLKLKRYMKETKVWPELDVDNVKQNVVKRPLHMACFMGKVLMLK